MRVLVVGGGGREHAIVEALRRNHADVCAAMANQNPGSRRASKDVLLVNVTAVDEIVRWAVERQVELAISGPEGPLERGITDALEAAGVPTVGPSREAAQLETNKEFTRDLMRDHGIPGAPRSWAFGDLDAFSDFVKASDFEFVIKPLGLTGGKGVRVWGDHFATKEEGLAYGREILEKKIGGVARFLVEEKLVGEEFSLQAFCDGRSLVPAPIAQDHKRAYEGDRGPNTGGMGSFSDANHRLPFLTEDDFAGALQTMRQTVVAMDSRGTPFKGILYGGFMATKDGPKLLEFNVRFADPEAMNVLPIFEDDFLETCQGIVEGRLPSSLRFAPRATVCKYVVPMGYGTHPLDLLTDDLRLPDVPTRVEAPRHERERLLRDRFCFSERRGDPDDREGARRCRVQVPRFLVDARIEEFRPGRPDAILVHFELLACPRMGSIAHRDDVLADGGPRGEPEGGGETALHDPLARFQEVVFEDRQDVHRFRIRETHVELEELGTVLRRHEAAVQDSLERRPARVHRDDGLSHRLQGAREVVLREERETVIRVAEGPHAARVGTPVPLVRPLVVLSDGRGDQRAAVAEGLQGKLLPHQLLFHEEPGDAADLLLEDFAAVGEGFLFRREMVPPHADAFPAGQPERLDHELEIGGFHEVRKRIEVAERPGPRGAGNPVVAHQVPRELLVRLELGRLPRRSDRRDARRFEGVGDASLERAFGSDDREFDLALDGPPHDLIDRGHVDQEDVLRRPSDPGILIRHRGERVRVVAPEGFHGRMLATASPDHEDPHGA